MQSVLMRIVKHGLISAVTLAVIGYIGAETAGIWIAANAPIRPAGEGPVAGNADDIALSLKYRLPFTMAAWGIGLVALFEIVLWLYRGRKPAPPPGPPAPKPDDVEQLLNELLVKAEADQKAAAERTTPKLPT